MSLPWDLPTDPVEHGDPVMVVDLRRCTGCHACSVACKTEHGVPLGQFRMRVRWMEHPTEGTIAFLPVFDAQTCDYGVNRGGVGLPPACVTACPTKALILGDADDPQGAPQIAVNAGARPLNTLGDTKPGVLYRGHEDWQEAKLNRGVALDPADEDITYEQGAKP